MKSQIYSKSFINYNFYSRLWCIALVVKLFLSTLFPLLADEAYYWVWAQNLQLSYYDHPPMIAWLISLTNFLPSYCVRFSGVVLGHMTLFIWDKVFQNLNFNESQRLHVFILLLFSPIYGFGNLILTPDLPLLFFIALSFYLLIKFLNTKDLMLLLFFGMSLGFGFVSKYHMVIFGFITLAIIIAESQWKLLSPKNIVIVLIGFIITAWPVFYWNSQNDWISFRFQLQHGLKDHQWQWHYPLEYLLGVVVIGFPILFAFFNVRFELSEQNNKRLFIFILVPFLFFLLTSFKGKVEANWPSFLWAGAYGIFVLYYSFNNWFTRVSLIFWIALYALFFLNLYFPITILQRSRINEGVQFKNLESLVKEYQPLYVNSYQMASQLWFNTGIKTLKLPGISRRDFFDFIPFVQPKSFYLIKFTDQAIPEWAAHKYRYKILKNLTEDLELVMLFE